MTWEIVGYLIVIAVSALVLFLAYMAYSAQDRTPVSVDQILHQLVTESDNERAALALILTNEAGKVADGREILEEIALRGRPTAQRHLATYWALTNADERRARVYQWLLIALACARGLDQQAGTGKDINYLLFLTNIALIENSTSDGDKIQGKTWAKAWFTAHADAPGLLFCDASIIDTYSSH